LRVRKRASLNKPRLLATHRATDFICGAFPSIVVEKKTSGSKSDFGRTSKEVIYSSIGRPMYPIMAEIRNMILLGP
jgi:hypothetical protein